MTLMPKNPNPECCRKFWQNSGHSIVIEPKIGPPENRIQNTPKKNSSEFRIRTAKELVQAKFPTNHIWVEKKLDTWYPFSRPALEIQISLECRQVWKEIHRVRIACSFIASQSVSQSVSQAVKNVDNVSNKSVPVFFSFQLISKLPSSLIHTAEVHVDNADSPDLPTARNVMTIVKRSFMASALPTHIRDSEITFGRFLPVPFELTAIGCPFVICLRWIWISSARRKKGYHVSSFLSTQMWFVGNFAWATSFAADRYCMAVPAMSKTPLCLQICCELIKEFDIKNLFFNKPSKRCNSVIDCAI